MLISYLIKNQSKSFTIDQSQYEQRLEIAVYEAYMLLLSLVLENEGYTREQVLEHALYASDNEYQAMSYALFELGIDEFSIMCAKV